MTARGDGSDADADADAGGAAGPGRWAGAEGLSDDDSDGPGRSARAKAGPDGAADGAGAQAAAEWCVDSPPPSRQSGAWTAPPLLGRVVRGQPPPF